MASMQLAQAALAVQLANQRRIDVMAKTITQVQQQFSELFDKVDTFTTDIAKDIKYLGDQLTDIQGRITRGELVPAEALDPIITALNNRAEALKAVASTVDSPVPPPPPPVDPIPTPTPTPTPSTSGSSSSSSSSSGSASSSGSGASSSGPPSSSGSGSSSGSSSSSSSSLPGNLTRFAGLVVTPTGMPVYTFDNYPASTDESMWPRVKEDATGRPLTLDGNYVYIYTFVNDTPWAGVAQGDGADGGAWHAVH